VARQLDKYIQSGQLKFVYRYMAFLGDESQWAAEAAECAAEQGKFWDYHDKIFANHKGENQGVYSKDNLKKFAADLQLDTAKFNQCLDSGKYTAKIKQSNDAAAQVGINSTPSVVINGVLVPGQALGSLDSILPYFFWLGGNPKQYAAPDKVIDPAKKYTATIKTAKGDIVIELLADRAPNTVNSFVFLAKSKFFDGITFHRVLEGFVAQGGDPSGTGIGGPGYTCNDEIDSSLMFDKPGVLAMANSGANTNGSQFFITFASRPELNGKYTIFGRVVSGQDVASKITLRDPQSNPNAPPGDTIQTVVIEEK